MGVVAAIPPLPGQTSGAAERLSRYGTFRGLSWSSKGRHACARVGLAHSDTSDSRKGGVQCNPVLSLQSLLLVSKSWCHHEGS